jgi:hypothetical protein
MPLVKTASMGKLTEDPISGQPLWNGNPWPSGGAATSIDWNNVFNKPTVFPPATHVHSELHLHANKIVLDDLTDVGGVLHYKGYPVAVSTVEWVDILNKPTTYPSDPHTHDISEVINLNTTLVNLQNQINNKAEDDHTHPELHTHTNKDALDLIDKDTEDLPTWNGGPWPGTDSDLPVGTSGKMYTVYAEKDPSTLTWTVTGLPSDWTYQTGPGMEHDKIIVTHGLNQLIMFVSLCMVDIPAVVPNPTVPPTLSDAFVTVGTPMSIPDPVDGGTYATLEYNSFAIYGLFDTKYVITFMLADKMPKL